MRPARLLPLVVLIALLAGCGKTSSPDTRPPTRSAELSVPAALAEANARTVLSKAYALSQAKKGKALELALATLAHSSGANFRTKIKPSLVTTHQTLILPDPGGSELAYRARNGRLWIARSAKGGFELLLDGRPCPPLDKVGVWCSPADQRSSTNKSA